MATNRLADGYAKKDNKHCALCYCMHFKCLVVNQILPFLCWYFSCTLKMNMNLPVVFCAQKVSVSILYYSLVSDDSLFGDLIHVITHLRISCYKFLQQLLFERM